MVCSNPHPFIPACCTTENCIAQEDVPIFRIITASGYRANSNNTTRRGETLGMTMVYINCGWSGTVAAAGEVYNPNWSFNRGDVLFLNGYVISTTPPATGFIQVIGKAVATNILRIDIQPSVLL